MSEPGGRYRPLLRAYPPGPRRDEVLGTLVEAGRAWPTPRETVNLLRWGLRARLGRPASRTVVLVAMMFSLVCGFLAASVAHRIALTDEPALPSGAALTEIQSALFPGLPAWADQDGVVFSDLNSPSATEILLGSQDEDFWYASVTVGPGSRFLIGDYRSWTEQAAGRLAAAGWEAGPAEATATDDRTGELVPDGTYLTARRGDLTMELNTGTSAMDTPPGRFDVTAVIRRFPPRSATLIALAAGLPATLLGWLAFGWASRRTEHVTGSARFLTRVPGLVAAVVMVPLWLSGTSGFVTEAFRFGPADQPFWGMTVTSGYGYALFAGVLCLPALIVTVRARRTPPAVPQPA
jgi:hypothetical protein